MARFEVQGPDGRTYEVEAPSAEAAAAAIGQMLAPEQPVGVGQDVAMGGASGVTRGVAGIFDLPSIGFNIGQNIGRSIYERVTGRSADEMQAEADIEAVSRFNPLLGAMLGSPVGTRAAEAVGLGDVMTYEPQTLPGRIVQRVGENLPAAAALPVGGLSLPVRVAGGAVLPGITGQVAEEAAEAMGASPLAAELTGLGAEVLTPNIFAAGGALARRGLIGPEARAFEPGSERAQAVATLRGAGIEDISLGQELGSESLMRAEGVPTIQRGTALDLNMFLMRNLGSDDPRPTPEALGRVADRLGAVFDEAEAVISVVPSQQVGQQVADAAMAYIDATGLDRLPYAVRPIVENIQDAIQSGRPITQENMQQWRPVLRSLMERASSPGVPTANGELAGDLMEALNNIVVEGARAAGDPGLFSRLIDARRMYRDYIDVIRALRTSNSADAASGLVTPAALYSRMGRRYGDRFYSAREGQQLGSLAEVARASRQVLGDLERVPVGGYRFSPSGAGLATVAAILGQNAVDPTNLERFGVPLAAYLAPQVSQAALRSRAGQRALTGPMGIIPALAQRGMPLGAVAGLGGLTGPQ